MGKQTTESKRKVTVFVRYENAKTTWYEPAQTDAKNEIMYFTLPDDRRVLEEVVSELSKEHGSENVLVFQQIEHTFSLSF